MHRSSLALLTALLAVAPASVVVAAPGDPPDQDAAAAGATPTSDPPAGDAATTTAPPTTASATAPPTAPPTTTPRATTPPPPPGATTSTAPTTPVTTSTPPTTTTVAPSSGPSTTIGSTTTSTSTPTSTSTTTTTSTTLPPVAPVVVRSDQIEYILATIRYLESRGRYDIPPNRGGASGAYQYIRSTWAGYGGYEEAYLAPPWVQDERAAADVEAILRRWDNDVSKVPITWYYPAALTRPELLDVVPKPEAGNVLTIREYQMRWLDTLAWLSGQPLPPRVYPLPPGLELLSGLPPVVPTAADGGLEVAFPLLGPAAVAPPAPCETDCDVPRPALVYGRKLQPVLAVADGVVTDVGLEDPITGEVHLTITDTAGRSYRYTGFNDDTPGTDDGAAPAALRLTGLAVVGRTVRAGQIVGFLGDSDPTAADENGHVWPRLRIDVTDLAGQPVDAEGPVTAALFRQTCTVGIGPWSVPPHPDTVWQQLEPVEIELADGDGEGGWRISEYGEVTAVGVAALVYPTAGCQWSPPEPFGPWAGGNPEVPLGFGDRIRLSAEVWAAVALGGDGFRPASPLRRG